MLSKVKEWLKALWAQEPVRTRVYSLLVLLAGGLVAKGTLDSDVADVVLALLAVALGVTAVETTRAKVTPTVKVEVVTLPVEDVPPTPEPEPEHTPDPAI